jgi:hypothetical protein
MTEKKTGNSDQEILDAEEREILAALSDTIIPPSADAQMPGAGSPGIQEKIFAAIRTDPHGRSVYQELLTTIRNETLSRDAPSFALLDAVARVEIVSRIESKTPETFAYIVAQICKQYYQDPRVVAAIGLEARPPYPKGFAVAATDPSLLDPVRRRAPLYKKC